MGKSKKQIAAVLELPDIGSKKKGKRGMEKENDVKPTKKQKITEKEKETEEDVKMGELEEALTKASGKVSGNDRSGKSGSKAKSEAPKSGKNGKKTPKVESGKDSSNSDEETAQAAPKAKADVQPNVSKVKNEKSDKQVSGKDGSGKKDKKSRSKAGSEAPKSVPAMNGKKAAEEDSEEDSSDDDEEPFKPPVKANADLQSKGSNMKSQKGTKQESSSDDDSSDDDVVPKAQPGKVSAKQASKNMQRSIRDDSDESDEEAESKQHKSAAPAADKPKEKAPVEKLESSDEEDGSDDSEEELDAEEEKLVSRSAANDVSERSDNDDKDEEKDEEVEVNTTCSKKEKTAKPKTIASSVEKVSSTTVFVKNLAWSVDENSVKEVFEGAGRVLEVRLAKRSNGQFRGFGHVEFSSEEAAKKACELTGETLAGRDLVVEMARERGSSSQCSGSDLTAFVKGFDKFQDEELIRNSLTEFFGDCGVQSIRIPTDRETGNAKGFAYVDFADKEALSKAIGCSGSDLNGRSLFIEEAGGGPRSGGGGRGRGRGGDFGGRGGKGRGGGRGDSRKGGRGFGGSMEKHGLFGAGKKKNFKDD